MATHETNVSLWNGLVADYDAYQPRPWYFGYCVRLGQE